MRPARRPTSRSELLGATLVARIAEDELCSVGDRPDLLRRPAGVQSSGPIADAGIGWPSVGFGRRCRSTTTYAARCLTARRGARVDAASGAYTGRFASWSQSVLPDARRERRRDAAESPPASQPPGRPGYDPVRSPKTRSLPEAKNSCTLTPYERYGSRVQQLLLDDRARTRRDAGPLSGDMIRSSSNER